MVNHKTDFTIQAAILDKYISLSNPSVDPIGVDVVIKKIKESSDLYKYFFSQKPTPGWASILYKNGFFESPPSVIVDEKGYQLISWAPSAYLASVAGMVPTIVETVVNEIRTTNPVIHADLIEAVSKIPTENGSKLLSKINKWLNNEYKWWGVAESTTRLIEHFAKNNAHHEALKLLDELIRPIPDTATYYGAYYFGGEAKAKFELDYMKPDLWNEVIPSLEEIDALGLIRVLEKNLLLSIKLELDAIGRTDNKDLWLIYGWRTSISDSSKNRKEYYKDQLLLALRNSLHRAVVKDQEGTKHLLEHCLHNKETILRRLGIYILAIEPRPFIDMVRIELLDATIHDDLSVHNEYFNLLSSGFPELSDEDRTQVIKIIINGPDSRRTQELAERVSEETGEDREEYVVRHRETWIRDRLWAISSHLPDNIRAYLENLYKRYGIPEHPEFLVWSSGGYSISETSPFSVDELSEIDSKNLLRLLKNWKPNRNQKTPPSIEITYRGLSETVASLLLDYSEKYSSVFNKLIETPPAIIASLFTKAKERLVKQEDVPWASLLELAALTSEKVYIRQENHWPGENFEARIAVIRFIEEGLNEKHPGPEKHLPHMEEIISLFLEDTNPAEHQDKPSEGWFGYEDPITIAENTIRPKALICLFKALYLKAIKDRNIEIDQQKQQQSLIIPEFYKQLIESKLDKKQDTSWAVHSIFGRYIWLIERIDPIWFESKIQDIFPDENQLEGARYFASAWDSFVVFNNPSLAIINKLRPQYKRAIMYLSDGKLIKTHLDPVNRLSYHLFMEYFWKPYDLTIEPGETNLISEYFARCNEELRGRAIWTFWKLVESIPDENLSSLWPIAKAFWEWRIREISLSRFTKEYEREMEEFSRLPFLAPKDESITDLWPLLQPILPFANDYRVWHNIEEFLASRVDKDPENVIYFYRKMHEIANKPEWGHRSYQGLSDKILFTAIKKLSSRKDAIAVIDMIFRSGNDKYRDLYEQFTSTNLGN